MEEEWAELEEFPNYVISTQGRIRHKDREHCRQISVNENGFPIVVLFGRFGGESKTRYLRQVNKLVADTFLERSVLDDCTSVWHIDGDLMNCDASNLKWDTRGRVLEWNEMHRSRTPRYDTPSVHNVYTGRVYDNAFECAMDEGRLESDIVWRAERGSPRYQYV